MEGICTATMDKLLPHANTNGPAWAKALHSVHVSSGETSALDVDARTGMTELHLAILARASSIGDASTRRLAVIAALLHRHPESTAVRCRVKGYTPLIYAVQTVMVEKIDEDAVVVNALLLANPASIGLKADCPGRLDPISVHIISVSRLLKLKASPCASTSVLQVLVAQSDLVQLERALETIYTYNAAATMERFSEEEVLHSFNVQHFGRHTRVSPGLTDFWVWEWVLCLLKGIQQKRDSKRPDRQSIPKSNLQGATSYSTKSVSAVCKTRSLFHALHTASQVTDCPIPFVLLAMRAYPCQVRVADRQCHYNLPLHSAASWQPRQSSCRKSVVLTSLVAEFPKAVYAKNKQGRNPIEVEAESGAVIE